MKRTNKKGFTIVELVVVIAVIAILAAIMIPVFSGVTNDAQDAADLADAKSIYTQYVTKMVQDKKDPAETLDLAFNDEYYFSVVKGEVKVDDEDNVVLTKRAATGYCVNEYGVYAEHNPVAASGGTAAKNCTNCGGAAQPAQGGNNG